MEDSIPAYLRSTLEQELAKKNYLFKYFGKEAKMKEGTIYLDFMTEEVGNGLFPSCKITITIKKGSMSFKQKKDLQIFTNTTIRQFPRTTSGVSSRCKLSIRDNLLPLPSCKK